MLVDLLVSEGAFMLEVVAEGVLAEGGLQFGGVGGLGQPGEGELKGEEGGAE